MPRQDSSRDQRPIAVFASFSGAGGVERMLIHLLHGFVALGERV